MIKKNLAILIPVILFFTIFAKADVPPDAGYVRERIDLVTETAEDLSDYRFFLDFYGDLREIEIKSKERTVIPPMGGGARYRTAKFLAIPKKSLTDFGEKISGEQLEKLSEALKAKKIEGAVELAEHSFTRDIPSSQKPEKAFYKIEREAKILKATKVVEEQSKSDATQQLIPTNNKTAFIVGGTFMTLAVLIIGVFGFRKAVKKV